MYTITNLLNYQVIFEKDSHSITQTTITLGALASTEINEISISMKEAYYRNNLKIIPELVDINYFETQEHNIGSIIESLTAPSDGIWLECDGTNYSNTQYNTLANMSPAALYWRQLTPDFVQTNTTIGDIQKQANGNYLISVYEEPAGTLSGYYTTADFITYNHTYSATNVSNVLCNNTSNIVLGRIDDTTYTRSTNHGTTWSTYSLPATGYWNINYDSVNSIFVLHKYNSTTIYISSDGLSWDIKTLPIANYSISNIVTINKIVGTPETRIYLTPTNVGDPELIYTVNSSYTSFTLYEKNFLSAGYYPPMSTPSLICTAKSPSGQTEIKFINKVGGINIYRNLYNSKTNNNYYALNSWINKQYLGADRFIFYSYNLTKALEIIIDYRLNIDNTIREIYYKAPSNVVFEHVTATRNNYIQTGLVDTNRFIFVEESYSLDWNTYYGNIVWEATESTTEFVVPFQLSNKPGYKFWIKALNSGE